MDGSVRAMQRSEAVKIADLLIDLMPTARPSEAEKIKRLLQDVMPSALHDRPDGGELRIWSCAFQNVQQAEN